MLVSLSGKLIYPSGMELTMDIDIYFTNRLAV